MEADIKNTEEHKGMENMKMNPDKVTKNGPTVVFQISFPIQGIYKVFAQLNPNGDLITTNSQLK